MLRAMLRDLRAHPGRVTMTVLAIVFGVGFVVATWVVSDSAAATVSDASSRSDLAATVSPSSPSAVESPSSLDPGGQLTESQRQQLAGLPGVTGAAGVTVGYAALLDSDGKVDPFAMPPYGGTNWDSSQRFNLVSGQAPSGPGEVAVERTAARGAGVGVGSSVRVLVGDPPATASSGSTPLAAAQRDVRTATVVGEFAYRTAGPEWTPVVAYDRGTATSLFGGGYARVELYGPDQPAIAAAASAALGSGYVARTGTDIAALAATEADDTATAVREFLLAFAGVALVVGMFVIANTFTMLVTQRTRQFALLRAVGATRRQVRRALLGEAAVLGGVGALIGVAAGIGLGAAILAVLRGTGETVRFVVSPGAVAVGLAVGVVVTLVAAYGSARRAALVAPVAALRTDAALPRRSLVVRTAFGAFFVAVGVLAVVGGSQGTLTDAKRALGMTGGLVAWLGVLLLAPLLVSAVLRPLARISSRRAGPALRLALRNAIRDPRRTAATASALMIGLALVCAFATVGQSLSLANGDGIRNTVPESTLVVRSALIGNDLDPAVVAQALSSASGTGSGAVSGAASGTASDAASGAASGARRAEAPRYGEGELRFGAEKVPSQLTGIDPAALGEVVSAPLTEGSADLAGGILVPTGVAERLGIHVGDQVDVRAPGAADGTAVTVIGLYQQTQLLNGILMSSARLPSGMDTNVSNVFVSGDGDARTRLEQAFADRPDVVVVDRDQLVDEAIQPLRLALGIIYALLGAAIVISIFGVVNTLALSVLERTREIGVLRAVGANRAFVRRSVRGESVVIATYGGILGVGVGLLLGGVMQHVLIGQPVLDFAVPYETVAVALVGMVVIGVVSALWPARRAARTEVLTAIAVE